jgi:5'-nucleotidase
MTKPYNIYCDMDGVLVDLQKGLRSLFGRGYNPEEWHKNGEEKKQIVRDHPNFWAELPPMEDFGVLWSFIEVFNPCILTAYARWDEEDSTREKWEWIQNYTSVPMSKFHCVARREKQLFAVSPEGKPNVLIDDYILNIREWRAAGGIGIMHSDAAHTIMRLKNLGFYFDEYHSKRYGNY